MRVWKSVVLVLALFMCGSALAVGEQILSDDMEGGVDCTTSAPSTVVVNVRSSLVRPVYRLNGQPFPVDAAQRARFFLVPREGVGVELSASDQTPQPVRVINGVYHVLYRWSTGTEIPRNFNARVLQNVVVAGDRDVLIDVPSTTLQGAVTLNGAPFPQLGPAGAFVSLQSVHRLGNIQLTSTNQLNYSVRLIPGAYRLRYAAPGAPSAIPANQSALLDRVDVEMNTLQRNFDIRSVAPRFIFNVDGQAAPTVASENGEISLRTADGDRVDLGESRTRAVTVNVIPGRYEAWWEGLTGAELVPSNRDSRFANDVEVGTDWVTLNVESRLFEGDFLVNGAPAPLLPIESGSVFLRDRLSGADVSLGSTANGIFSRRVMPGTYDLVYSRLAGSEIVPANGEIVFETGRVVDGQPNADINVPVGPIAWNLTLNGAPFLPLGSENGRVEVRSSADLANVLLGQTQSFGAMGGSRRLVPGSYRPSYFRITGAEVAPANTHAVIDATFEVMPGGGPLQTIDVHVGSWEFAYRNNGAPFAIDPARRASFTLRHRDDSVALGATDQSLGPRRLISNVLPLADGRTGTVHYTWLAGSPTQIPRNVDTPVSCHVLTQ